LGGLKRYTDASHRGGKSSHFSRYHR
jgi:hypothetical protein